jgi:hypothetical protein
MCNAAAIQVLFTSRCLFKEIYDFRNMVAPLWIEGRVEEGCVEVEEACSER